MCIWECTLSLMLWLVWVGAETPRIRRWQRWCSEWPAPSTSDLNRDISNLIASRYQKHLWAHGTSWHGWRGRLSDVKLGLLLSESRREDDWWVEKGIESQGIENEIRITEVLTMISPTKPYSSHSTPNCSSSSRAFVCSRDWGTHLSSSRWVLQAKHLKLKAAD